MTSKSQFSFSSYGVHLCVCVCESDFACFSPVLFERK